MEIRNAYDLPAVVQVAGLLGMLRLKFGHFEKKPAPSLEQADTFGSPADHVGRRLGAQRVTTISVPPAQRYAWSLSTVYRLSLQRLGEQRCNPKRLVPFGNDTISNSSLDSQTFWRTFARSTSCHLLIQSSKMYCSFWDSRHGCSRSTTLTNSKHSSSFYCCSLLP